MLPVTLLRHPALQLAAGRAAATPGSGRRVLCYVLSTVITVTIVVTNTRATHL